MQRNRRGIVVYVVLKASQATMAEQHYASVVDKVKAFLTRQSGRGILVTVPGEWEAWFCLGFRPESLCALAPMGCPSWWAGDIRRSILQERAAMPPSRQNVCYSVCSGVYRDVWTALNERILQHERWCGARHTWMRAVVLGASSSRTLRNAYR